MTFHYCCPKCLTPWNQHGTACPSPITLTLTQDVQEHLRTAMMIALQRIEDSIEMVKDQSRSEEFNLGIEFGKQIVAAYRQALEESCSIV